jgi:tRNA (guanine6-N2)-methyltransferase
MLLEIIACRATDVHKEKSMAVDLFVVTNRGLEPICAAEMRQIPALSVKTISYRRVSAVLRGNLSSVLRLRTVDDVFIDLGTWTGIGPHRIVLETLKENSRELTLVPAIEIIKQARPVSRQPAFSVTANFVGKRNYNMDEIKAAVATGVMERHDWRCTTEDESEINLRIFIEHDNAYIGMRVGAVSLHRRPYKQSHLPGSLKPSVAAAMLQVAETAAGMRVLDPLCGAGTIPIEAALQGAKAWGGDLNAIALNSARTNLIAAGAGVRLHQWDAVNLPLAAGSVDRIVTNLPWGRQVQVDEDLVLLYRRLCVELERVLDRRGQIVLLTSLPDLVRLERLTRSAEIEISLFGQNPMILKYTA